MPSSLTLFAGVSESTTRFEESNGSPMVNASDALVKMSIVLPAGPFSERRREVSGHRLSLLLAS